MLFMKKTLLSLCLAFGALTTAHAEGLAPISRLWDAATSELQTTWEQGGTEAYLPLHTHHLRSAYDADKIASYNENPWGFGLGKGYKDDNGTWHGLYAMEFLDSHSKVEPFIGYGYTRPVLHLGSADFALGYTAFVTARNDIGNYTPIPGLLPLAAVESKKAALMATFVPGGHNNGNVLFIFGRYHLN